MSCHMLLCREKLLRCVVFCQVVFLAVHLNFPAIAKEPKRVALLIGNQSYSKSVGALKNPHNDIRIVGSALAEIGFDVTLVKDATYRQMDVAIKRHLVRVRKAGAGAISFVYYSGHGVAQPGTRINYILPVDVENADADIWYGSFEQHSIIDRIKRQAHEATHYIVFDACRNELNLTVAQAKSIGAQKGFEPVSNESGILIAYATAPGRTASDAGEGGGAYAKALAEELLTPGVEAVGMFRRVQLRVSRVIAQEPWLTYGTLPEVYFAGRVGPDEREWLSIRDTENQSEIQDFIKRHPKSSFSETARMRLAIIHERKRRAEAEQAAIRWKSIQNLRDPNLFVAYVKEFADSPFRLLAEARIRELERRRHGTALQTNALDPSEYNLVRPRPSGDELPHEKSDDKSLVYRVQEQLDRIGCKPGPIDGLWGDTSQDALRRFNAAGRVALPIDQPTVAMLQILKKANAGHCRTQPPVKREASGGNRKQFEPRAKEPKKISPKQKGTKKLYKRAGSDYTCTATAADGASGRGWSHQENIARMYALSYCRKRTKLQCRIIGCI